MADLRPKCKVVLREHEGSRGARIHPRGCRVTGRVQTLGGERRKVDKRGVLKQRKVKVKTSAREFMVHARSDTMIAGAPQHLQYIYDTGATNSTANLVAARQLGLISGADNTPTQRYVGRTSEEFATTASGQQVPVTRFQGVQLTLRETGRSSRADMVVFPRASLLFGVGHMRGQRKFLSVKYK